MKEGRSIFGMVKTHWAWPTSATTSSCKKAANSAARLAQGQKVFVLAVFATDASKAILEDPAVEVACDRPVQDASSKAVRTLEEILPGPLDVLVKRLDELVQGSLCRSSRPVNGRFHEKGPWQISCPRKENEITRCVTEGSSRPRGFVLREGDKVSCQLVRGRREETVLYQGDPGK